MLSHRKLFWVKAAVILAALPVLITAYEYGPDPGNTGAPGETTCAQAGCHTGTAVNGGGGSVTVTFPSGLTYTPGVTQRLVVTVSDPAQRRWGFQLTARLADNSQAGALSPATANTQVLCSTPPFLAQVPAPCPANLPVQFIEHTSAGYDQANPSFPFDWTPPAASGNVTIYVAGNAANGDLTNWIPSSPCWRNNPIKSGAGHKSAHFFTAASRLHSSIMAAPHFKETRVS